MHEDAPRDPFADDPNDPSAALGQPTGDGGSGYISLDERERILSDLSDLDVFRALLEPLGIRGVVTECVDCGEPHFLDWDLLHDNLRRMLDEGQPRPHEPALNPDPDDYVTWEYARGYVDGVIDSEEGGTS